MGPERTRSIPAAGVSPFEALYRTHFRYVWHVLRRMGVAPREREDLCQEVFLTVHRGWSRYDASRPILPWVHGIAFNVARRHQALARHHREVLMDDDEATHHGHDPEHLTAADQARELVIKLMQTIDLDRRVVLSMHDLDGISMLDITTELGIPMSTGYKRLETARREMQAAAARAAARERRVLGQAAVFAVPFNLAAFLDADRFIPDAPTSARAGVWARLQGAIALEAPGGARAPGGTGATAPTAPKAARLAARVAPHAAPFVLGALVGAGALYALLPRHPASPASERVAQVTAAVEPAAPAPVIARTATAASSAVAAVAPIAGPSTAQAPRATLDEDTLIQRARMAYAHGDTQNALDALSEHARRHPGGRLAADREALRAQVLERQRAAGAAASALPSAASPGPTATAPAAATSATTAPHRMFGTDE
jgi:RNA polymerase sigma-70 factor (ECF subfamily)